MMTLDDLRAYLLPPDDHIKFPDANGICGHSLRPPIEEAINRLCNQLE